VAILSGFSGLGIYPPEAGNMALKVMTTGGVYLGGGIPPRILPALKKVILLFSIYRIPVLS
jgi:glucokinase